MSDPVIRLLVSDVDGTLVRGDKSLAPATVDAAKRLIAAGGAMTLISARPPSGLLPLAREMGLVDRIGAFNGGTIVTVDGEIVAAKHLSADAGRRALDALRAAGVTRWAFADGKWFASDDRNPHTDRERKSSMVDPVVDDDFGPLHGRIDKLVGVTDDAALLKRVTDEIRDALGEAAEVSNSQTYYIDVTHRQANKGDGIVAIAESIGVPLSETAAIGDMPNDLPMLRRAAMPIAMGQAPEEVKRVAMHVTSSNDEDGVAHAIDRFVLPALPRDR